MYRNKLFLASQSPRRRELSSYLFDNIEVIQFHGDEPTWQGSESAEDYLRICCAAKWSGALKPFHSRLSKSHRALSDALLVADTIVVLGRRVLGKPGSPAEAVQMLKDLSGREHVVLTGFQIGFDRGDSVADSGFVMVKSRVRFAKLSLIEIQAYVRTKEPMDKAGAYGFQDHALRFVERCPDSYTNIVGLPIFDVEHEIEKLGFGVKNS